MKTLRGIIHVTGEHDTGKTTFALECGARPPRIWFLDDDVKGRATVDELRDSGIEFGRYDDLVSLGRSKREIEFHDACIEMITSERPGRFDVIVWDTWTRFAKTCHPYVLTHLADFRLKWSPMGRIKGAEQWQEAQRYEAQILDSLQELAPTVIIVTHLKDFYLNSAKTDKMIPACSRTLTRIPRFRIWLRHNPHSPVPTGLVLKRLDKKEMTARGLRTVCVLPRKITPMAEDKSLWDTIARYHEHPVNLRPPMPEEMPNEYELSILDGTLTADQRRTLNLMLRAGAVRKDEEPEQPDRTDRIADAKRLKAAGEMNVPAIARETGLSVREVAKL